MANKITENSEEKAARDFPVSPLAARIFALAATAGAEARIVGGAVRDWVMRRPIGDIDMAISLPITDAADLLRADGLKVIETGIDHGTVTVVAGGETIEVTQTRIDVTTDGRHAEVAFSPDWAADAARRDLTMNALYLTAEGRIDDPLGGQRDLAAGRVRFAGKAADRVQEDALRMLRYCRFVAHMADAAIGGTIGGTIALDADAEAALRAYAGLARDLSGERVADEFQKICRLTTAMTAFAVMQDTGVARAALGCDLAVQRAAALLPLHALDGGAGATAAKDNGSDEVVWVMWLAAMTAVADHPAVAARLRLSRKHQHLLQVVTRDDAAFDDLNGGNWRQAAWPILRARGNPAATYAVGAARRDQLVNLEHFKMIAGWHPPECPVTGADLLSHGVDNGPAVGQLLGAIEQRWVASDFALDKAALLADL